MAERGRAALATAPRSFVLDLTQCLIHPTTRSPGREHGPVEIATWPSLETVGARTHRPDRKGPNGPCPTRSPGGILPRSTRAGVEVRAKGFSVSSPDRSVQATGGLDFRV